METFRPCISCKRSLNRVGGRHLLRSMPLTQDYIENNPFVLDYLVEVCSIRQIADGDRFCRNCFRRAQRYFNERIRQQNQEAVEEPAVEPPPGAAADTPPQLPAVETHQLPAAEPSQAPPAEPPQEPVVEPPQGPTVTERPQQYPLTGYSRAPFNTRLCIFATCMNGNLLPVKKHLRAAILREKGFYIPRRTRVCHEHRHHDAWLNVEMNTRHVYNTFTLRQVTEMLNLLRMPTKTLNFEQLSGIDDNMFHYYIGFSKAKFQEVLITTPSLSRLRQPATILACFLVKLRTGEPNKRLAKLFRISRQRYEAKMDQARECLMREFVPRHLGYNHISREEMIHRCLAIPNALFGNSNDAPEERIVIVIFDGTYIYLQKSSNYYFQRKSYSMHKWRNLYKPFLMVCPDGHIIDIYGPYEATTSDSVILNKMLQSRTDPFHWVYKEHDVFILDRGFRDSVMPLQTFGYVPKLPATKSNRRRPQLSTEEANNSRKVTMCRWVVETINGRLKNQFKLLRHVANNRALTHLFEEIKIAGALLNAFGRPLTDHRLVADILAAVAERSQINENFLGNYVLANNMNSRRAAFSSITADNPTLDNFPILNEDDLIILSLGTYQLKQARSYYGEHIRANGSYNIEVYREVDIGNLNQCGIIAINPWLLRGRLQSRHRQAKQYYVYILLNENVRERDGIIGYYCSCVIGTRTLGSCAHVMSIIWYLGWGRHQENLCPPAPFLDTIIRHDVENEVYDETSDDETNII